MDLQNEIRKYIGEAFSSQFNTDLDPDEFQLQPTRKEFEGDYTFVVFPYLRYSKRKPEDSGAVIGDYLVDHSGLISGYNVVKGFLNLSVDNNIWLQVLDTIRQNENYGYSKPGGREVMVEFSSPNTNKPLHLGHLRNNFLGYSIARIYEAVGYNVIKAQIINDRGIHICKSMLAWKKFGNEEDPSKAGIKGDKLVGNYYVTFEKHYREQVNELVGRGMSREEAEQEAPLIKEAKEMLQKWEARDPEVYRLWKIMNGWVYEGFDETYDAIGVDFNKLYYESDTYLLGKEEVLKGLDKGVFYRRDDGSVWVDLSDEGLDEKLLLRSDGTSVYMTQDIGTAILRFNDYPSLEKLIYTVGNEQEYHFKVLFLILKKLGFDWADGLYHLSYGMVDLPSGKMKSREGTVVDADDLITEMINTAERHTRELGKIEGLDKTQAHELYRTLGLGALKYFLLKVDPRKRMLFNPEESIQFHGNTGPFIQYTHARISAILRRAGSEDLQPESENIQKAGKMHPVEKDVIFQISIFNQKIHEAAAEYSPAVIAQFIYELAKEYNRFYQDIPIFNEKDKNKLLFRVALSEAVAITIKKGMDLLGIEVPERM